MLRPYPGLLAMFPLLAACTESNGDGAGGATSASGATTTTERAATATQATSAAPAASTSQAGQSTGTGIPAGRVAAFVAQGHKGRTTISCDGGRTWVGNHSDDDALRCFEGNDCDHDPGAGRGLAYGAGLWVATFGWGAPGTVKVSSDGVTWETVLSDTGTYADIAFGNDVFVANAGKPDVSADGRTWTPAEGDLGLSINTRAIGFSPVMGGRFVVTGESGENRDIVVSADAGQTWSHASDRPDECVSYVRGIASNTTTFVLASGNGFVCTSTDGGDSWSAVSVSDGLTSPPIWTGDAFMVWNRNRVFTSADGTSWDEQEVTPSSVSIGPVARGDDGTFVAANDGWMVWYEEQELYRSTDGIVWEVLDKTAFTGSHPINFIEFGYAEPSADCPLP